MLDTYTRTDGDVTIETTINSLRHHGVMASRSAYTVTATVTYRGDDWTDTQRHTVTLTGSTSDDYPGPVALIDHAGGVHHVADPCRFGYVFGADYVRNFALGRTTY